MKLWTLKYFLRQVNTHKTPLPRITVYENQPNSGCVMCIDCYCKVSSPCVSATKTIGALDLEVIAEQLGIAAVVLQDLKEYRENNYQFSWKRMLNFRGDTGIFLQYTHARLNT